MDRLAVITGGTSGIGEEFANQLAKKGYNITIVGRNKIKGTMICKRLEEKNSIICDFLEADLTNNNGLKIVEDYIKSLDSLDFLVNGAGFGVDKTFLDGNIDQREDMIFVHNTVVMRLSYLAGTIMKKNHNGNIINISSLASFLRVGDPLYSSTKAFVRYFSTNIHYEWKKYGLYIQALCPGFVKTNFFLNAGTKTIPKLGLLDAHSVVKISLKYAKKGKSVCIPGFINKCLKILLQIVPNKLSYHIITKII